MRIQSCGKNATGGNKWGGLGMAGGQKAGLQERGTAWGDEIRDHPGPGPCLECPQQGGEIFILSAKGSHCPVESGVGTRAVTGVFSGPRETSSSQTRPFSGALELGVGQSVLSYGRSQKPHSFEGSRSLRQRSGPGRPDDGAETNRLETPRAANRALPSSRVAWLGPCQDTG